MRRQPIEIDNENFREHTDVDDISSSPCQHPSPAPLAEHSRREQSQEVPWLLQNEEGFTLAVTSSDCKICEEEHAHEDLTDMKEQSDTREQDTMSMGQIKRNTIGHFPPENNERGDDLNIIFTPGDHESSDELNISTSAIAINDADEVPSAIMEVVSNRIPLRVGAIAVAGPGSISDDHNRTHDETVGMAPPPMESGNRLASDQVGLPIAAEVKRSSPKWRRRSVLVIGVVLVVGLVVALAVALQTSLSSSTSSNDNDHNATNELYETLTSSSFDSGKALHDTRSSQYEAYQFLSNMRDLEDLSPERLIQRYALATFYYSTGGSSWSSDKYWTSYADECNWEHLRCDNMESVSELHLSMKKLSGELPPELFLLSNLEIVSLGYNTIRGTLPTEVGLLGGLTHLKLASNGFTGPIPSEIGECKKLKVLHTFWTAFTGRVPDEICALRPPSGQLEILNEDCKTPCACSTYWQTDWLDCFT